MSTGADAAIAASYVAGASIRQVAARHGVGFAAARAALLRCRVVRPRVGAGARRTDRSLVMLSCLSALTGEATARQVSEVSGTPYASATWALRRAESMGLAVRVDRMAEGCIWRRA